MEGIEHTYYFFENMRGIDYVAMFLGASIVGALFYEFFW